MRWLKGVLTTLDQIGSVLMPGYRCKGIDGCFAAYIPDRVPGDLRTDHLLNDVEKLWIALQFSLAGFSIPRVCIFTVTPGQASSNFVSRV